MAEPPKQPSDFYPPFTWPRLIALAEIMIERRTWVAENARPDLGDSACCTGLRAYDQTKLAIARAAATEFREWLSVADPGPWFVFKICMMPARFCRADSELPLPPNYAHPTGNEAELAELALKAEGMSTKGVIFRLVIEADHLQYPHAVVLVLADINGNSILAWRIPRRGDSSGTTPIVPPHKPIDLGPLTVETEEEAAKREAAEKAAEQERAKQLKKNPKPKGA